MMDLDLDQLEALAAVVSEGTFDAAARSLHVTPSAVSQRIKALERSVGRVLVTRTKPVQATVSGQSMLRLARQIHTATAEALHELDQDVAEGPTVMPLAVNADSLATWLLPAFSSVGPSVVFDLQRDDQERTADLLRQGAVMAAVTSLADAVPGCSVERLGPMTYHPMASPEFARAWFPDGATAAELARAPVIVFDRQDRLQDTYLRRRSRRHLDPPRHYVPGSGAFLEAVRLGLGWGMVPDLQVAAHRDGARLHHLDPAHGVQVDLYWQQWRLRSATLELVAAAVRTTAVATLC
jgi:LysR family transcriptional regulator, chromosome initiation inhibitor